MKRFALLLLLVGRTASFAASADPAVDDLFKQAQAATAAGKFDDAVNLYEQVLTRHPDASARWFEAQLAITQALAKKGDWDEAAKAAHLSLDAAPSLQAFDRAVTVAADILSAQDKNVERANQFLKFEENGLAAVITNPMEAVGYPSQPDRESAFAAIRAQAGDDAAATRLRAATYLLTGKPRDALAQFADGFRRCSIGPETARAAAELVLIGLRAVRGHRAGLEKDLQFVIYGPNGPDGKPGTPDDWADPFAKFLPAPPPLGQAGLTQLNPEDLAALQQVRAAAQLYWGDPFLFPEIRGSALAVLVKVTSALDEWGGPGQKEHYLQLALGPVFDEQTRLLLFNAAELAARDRQLDFGQVHALWAVIDADMAAQNTPSTKGMDEARKEFENFCKELTRTPFPDLVQKQLKTPAKF